MNTTHSTSRYQTCVAIGAALCSLLTAGCGQSAPSRVAIAEQPHVAKLPVSLNAVMVALVNESAGPVWLAATTPPQTEGEWRSLQRASYQLELSGSLLTMPGTGPMDVEWTARPEWQSFATQLGAAGAAAVSAVASRDQPAIGAAGDQLVEACEGCHKVFKPDLPTGKMFGEIRPR